MSNDEEKNDIRQSISKLEDEISLIADEVNIDPENYFPDDTDLPGLNLDVKIFDNVS